MLLFRGCSTVLDREGSKRRELFPKIQISSESKEPSTWKKYIFFIILKGFIFFIIYKAAMGIHGNIWQCLCKCRPILILRRQKKYHRKDFHVWGLYFHVSCTVFFIIFEKFNLIYNNLTSTLLQNCNSFSSPSRI